MITKANDLRTSEQSELRGGKGTVFMHHFLEGENSFGTGRLFARATLPPGSSIGTHTHSGEYEIYYVLKGKVKVFDNGVPAYMDVNDCMICKDGDNHSIENDSDQDAELLFLVINSR